MVDNLDSHEQGESVLYQALLDEFDHQTYNKNSFEASVHQMASHQQGSASPLVSAFCGARVESSIVPLGSSLTTRAQWLILSRWHLDMRPGCGSATGTGDATAAPELERNSSNSSTQRTAHVLFRG